MQELRDEINRRILADLQAHGFRVRANGLHTRDLDGDALYRVTTPVGVSRLTGLVSIVPNVGIRIHAIERLVADLSGYPLHRYYPLTATVAGANFTPFEEIDNSVPRINWWSIGTIEEADHQVPLIIRAIAVDGLAWAEKHRNFDCLIAHMRSQPGDANYHTQLPVALLLAGRRDEARQALDGFLWDGIRRNDGAMESLRRFSYRFRPLT
jgi:hypothetical protein